MLCNLCGLEVVLVPSAAERARKDVTGKSAAYFTSLFPQHSTCILKKRAEDTSKLMKEAREQNAKK